MDESCAKYHGRVVCAIMGLEKVELLWSYKAFENEFT